MHSLTGVNHKESSISPPKIIVRMFYISTTVSYFCTLPNIGLFESVKPADGRLEVNFIRQLSECSLFFIDISKMLADPRTPFHTVTDGHVTGSLDLCILYSSCESCNEQQGPLRIMIF